MRFRICAAAVVAASLSLSLVAALGQEKAPPKATVDDLAWMAGRWEERNGDSVFEEWWLPPAGKTLAAVSREVRDGATRMYELSAIEPDEAGGLVLLIRHFGAGLAPWKQEAAGPGRWRLVETGKQSVVFEDPAHDFPRRIGYAAGKGDTLEVTLEGAQGGRPAKMQFAFKRAK
jgi:hypothetical protein